ncbi:CopG family transcriptional regulator [Lachnospiraceae bacterium JLR.KK009]|nr:CopG family transcriptional regulator [Lachnospiraceae bacterium]MCI8882635.1 CopG family transcriptional regulator [Lachnospiraceae bacterium]
MGNKKMGRPTDNPKNISLKVRLDSDTSEKLEECTRILEVSKAEIVRQGVHRVYDGLMEQ